MTRSDNSRVLHMDLERRVLKNKHNIFVVFFTFFVGAGAPRAPQEIPRLRLQHFSQTFPAMLLRLVGTADTAGDCEKIRRVPFESP